MVDVYHNVVLPDECARGIWTLLQHEDLRAAMRVSSSWARSVAPFLYRDIDIRSGPGLQALLRTTQRRPDLAALVHQLRLHQYTSSGSDHAQSLGSSAASLLNSLSALRELRLEGHWSGLEALISNGRLRVPFTNLRDLSLGRRRQSMVHILPFWALPRIESIQVRIAAMDVMCEDAVTSWPTASALTKLTLDYTSLEEKDVTLLLQHSPSLRSFRYDRWCDVTDEPSFQNCDELGRGLHHLHQTLEQLDLRVQLYSENAEEVEFLEIDPVRGRLPSFHGFSRLRTLRVPIATLLGWTPSEAPEIETLLPPSLQHLSLTEDLCTQCTYQWTEDSVLTKLDAFFAALAGNEHKLELIEISPDGTWGGWEDSTKEMVQKMATKAGMRCVIVDLAHSHYV
ncbi:hypothetical protein F4677DRAFT_402544 [Hypoxylon crocopeplum]|nr:hypothetical protein F4677DRAFT_402544 [Hypoxylon crocopeplum]